MRFIILNRNTQRILWVAFISTISVADIPINIYDFLDYTSDSRNNIVRLNPFNAGVTWKIQSSEI